MEKIKAEMVQEFGTTLDVIESLFACQNSINESVAEIENGQWEEKNKNMDEKFKKYSDAINSIPKFWMTVFCKHPVLDDWFNESDKKIFEESLTSFKMECDNATTLSFIFNFKENSYFTNESIKKTYHISNGEPKTISHLTNVNWRHKKYIPNGVSTSNTRISNTRSDNCYYYVSFFQWFCKPSKDEEAGDFQLAKILKDIWSNPLAYYNAAELGSAEDPTV